MAKIWYITPTHSLASQSCFWHVCILPLLAHSNPHITVLFLSVLADIVGKYWRRKCESWSRYQIFCLYNMYFNILYFVDSLVCCGMLAIFSQSRWACRTFLMTLSIRSNMAVFVFVCLFFSEFAYSLWVDPQVIYPRNS